LNFATPSKDLFTIFMLCFCPIFWLCDINICLVFSGFASRSTSLQASNKVSVFFFAVSMFPCFNMLIFFAHSVHFYSIFFCHQKMANKQLKSVGASLSMQ
jgi:hypothetical protein